MSFRLTPLELTVLLLSEKGYSLKKIAEILNMDEDMLEDVVKELVEKGFAKEVKKKKLFGRERYLILTDEGKRALREVAEVMSNVLASVKGMVEKGNIDGARAFLSKYIEYLPYAPLLGVAERSFVESLIRKMGYVPAYAPPQELYEEEPVWSSWEEEL
ncbi:hypothetical protein [Ignicoccus hospitalis]|uniref:HTH marR-type domain-containing protein n=1 Tax=Ignicoccus hospitalis (strain KIN4/I / DSM 18386 / JCM 14125) TaxID=453591 RepID=A8AAW2_IGNH4|nr:hypothetical protein [Ignicoccus hospitalis]ABU82064.1 hypothetical protein Igni_0882 [Ignicoccus hospitalis KIN4/I]HIH91021.1 hypothetical protein [Desulfurococcaceae archaeon]